MRIVLDVNVLVSAAITYDGPAYDAMELMARDDMYLFLSDAMFITLANVLARPKIVRRLDPNRPSEFMGRLRRLTSEKITPDPTVQGLLRTPKTMAFSVRRLLGASIISSPATVGC